MRDAQEAGDEGVTTGLLQHTLAGVDEHNGQVGRRRARHHVARVLNVAWGVGDDELASGGGEVAIGDVDGDALLALGPKPIREKGQVHLFEAALEAGLLDRFELVLEDRLGVVEQAADERALAVVYGAGGGDAQELHLGPRSSPHACGPPWRPRRTCRRRASPPAR